MSIVISNPVGDSFVSDFAHLDEITFTGNVNNLALPVGRGYRMLASGMSINISGIVAAPHNTMLLLYCAGSIGGIYYTRLLTLSALSSPGNKIITTWTGSFTVQRYRMLYLRYNETLDSGNGAWHFMTY